MNQKEDKCQPGNFNNENKIGKLCIKNCGFFGSPQFNGYCSICWQDRRPISLRSSKSFNRNDIVKIDLNTSSKFETRISNYESKKMNIKLQSKLKRNHCIALKSIDSSTLNENKENLNKERETKKMMIVSQEDTKSITSSSSKMRSIKERCPVCRRNINIISFSCRCGGQYCIAHRLAKEHSCSFDYRSQGMIELAKANPKIISDKIKKI